MISADLNSSQSSAASVSESLTRTVALNDNADDVQLSIDEIRKLLNLSDANTLSSYDELHTIGIGGFGAVYSAREPGLKRRLALKILRPRYRQNAVRVNSFVKEARITAQIAHPNIIPVHRIGVFADAGVYFSMKRVAGETLRSVIRKLSENRTGYRKKFTLNRLIDLYIGACQGVAYAHRNGILHCDLKPENLMVGDFGEIMVMDWGMARYVPELDRIGNVQITEEDIPGAGSAAMGGTPVYMAPEHLSLSCNDPDERSDIYALGCILYSILTWKSSPFEGAENLEDVQYKVVRGKITPPRKCAPPGQSLPRELEAICLKAMARNPGKRYHSVDDLLEDLRNYQDGMPVKAYSPSPLYKLSKLIFRHPLVPSALFLALLIWCVFSMYSFLMEHLHVQSLRVNATANLQSGELRMSRARRNLQQLKRGVANASTMRSLENAIETNSVDAELFYRHTLDYLSRIPQAYRKGHKTDIIARQIFRQLFTFYTVTRNDKKLKDAAEYYSQRYPVIFGSVRKWDQELDIMFKQALSDQGTIRFSGFKDLKWQLETAKGTPAAIVSRRIITIPNREALLELQLRCGLYYVKYHTPSGAVSRFPVRITLSGNPLIDIHLPKENYKEMIWIPGSEFIHEPGYSNNFSRQSFEHSFLIRRTEVSIGEYLEFWKSITDPEKKQAFRACRFSRSDSLQADPLWDDDGNILDKSLSLSHPVTGISGLAAEAYCSWFSKKNKCHAALPTRSQWSKAAGGPDGFEYSWGNTYKPGLAVIDTEIFSQTGTHSGDCSVYGVLDLSGNVREFVKVSGNAVHQQHLRNFGVAGGSYATTPELSRTSRIVYNHRGGNDVGFRYVINLKKVISGDND